jgi:hypothetical protein
MSCGDNLFGPSSQYIKTNNGDFIAIEGSNTVERLMLSDLRLPYKQVLRSRIILKAGQVNYLLNFLGLGDNATFLGVKAVYDKKSVIEDDNYINWNYYDDFSNLYSMGQLMILTGNSTNRVKQIYLTNPNAKYPVTLDVMTAVIDDDYSFFEDITNQGGTTFTGLTSSSIQSYVVGESIVINNSNSDPLIYIQLSNINYISRSSTIVTIDDDALGIILLVFTDEANAAQAQSMLSYVISNQSVNISLLGDDLISPVVYWLSNVGSFATSSFIDFNGSTSSVPYDTSYGFTFSTSMNLSDFGPTISKSNLIDLLIDHVSDNRDGAMSMTSSSIILLNDSSTSISAITASGTYSLEFSFTDLALNNLDGVILNLNIS